MREYTEFINNLKEFISVLSNYIKKREELLKLNIDPPINKNYDKELNNIKISRVLQIFENEEELRNMTVGLSELICIKKFLRNIDYCTILSVTNNKHYLYLLKKLKDLSDKNSIVIFSRTPLYKINFRMVFSVINRLKLKRDIRKEVIDIEKEFIKLKNQSELFFNNLIKEIINILDKNLRANDDIKFDKLSFEDLKKDSNNIKDIDLLIKRLFSFVKKIKVKKNNDIAVVFILLALLLKPNDVIKDFNRYFLTVFDLYKEIQTASNLIIEINKKIEYVKTGKPSVILNK